MRAVSSFVQCLAIISTGADALRNPVSTYGMLHNALSSRFETSTRPRLVSKPEDLSKLYPAYNFTVAVDHFHNDSRYEPHSDETFVMRYWFDATYYKKGGPVIVHAAGETSAVVRLPTLQKGIIQQLAKATNGIGVILEHRYYGESWPVQNLSTESLRFLTTDQAMADTAVFADNIVFPGLEHYNLTATATPWIAYGGSYAGAFVSFLRKLYPETFFGAISSSGVTEAINEYWQYNQPIIEFGPAKCIHNVRVLTHAMDNILTIPSNTKLIPDLQKAFNLGGIKSPQDFVDILWQIGVGGWQSMNWDPAIGNPEFGQYCDEMSKDVDLYKLESSKGPLVTSILTAAGYGNQVDELINPMLNWIGWTQKHAVDYCDNSGRTQDQCFSTFNKTFYEQDDISQTWRAWPYQFCTEWGYHITGSAHPLTSLPLVSRLIDLPYQRKICPYAFNITTQRPQYIDYINSLGGFKFTYPRLAVIVGKEDAWRDATPLARDAEAYPWPVDSVSEPVILIEGAGHHWDENGIFGNETKRGKLPPKPVREAQEKEVEFVREWLKEWKGAAVRDVDDEQIALLDL